MASGGVWVLRFGCWKAFFTDADESFRLAANMGCCILTFSYPYAVVNNYMDYGLDIVP